MTVISTNASVGRCQSLKCLMALLEEPIPLYPASLEEMAFRETQYARSGPRAVEGQSCQVEPLAHGRGGQNLLQSQ